jgi:hypothetical protein
VEEERSVRAKARPPSQAETRARHEDPLRNGSGLERGFMESDGRAASDKMRVGTRFMQKASQIHGRGSGADDGNSAAFKATHFLVTGTVSNEFF